MWKITEVKIFIIKFNCLEACESKVNTLVNTYNKTTKIFYSKKCFFKVCKNNHPLTESRDKYDFSVMGLTMIFVKFELCRYYYDFWLAELTWTFELQRILIDDRNQKYRKTMWVNNIQKHGRKTSWKIGVFKNRWTRNCINQLLFVINFSSIIFKYDPYYTCVWICQYVFLVDKHHTNVELSLTTEPYWKFVMSSVRQLYIGLEFQCNIIFFSGVPKRKSINKKFILFNTVNFDIIFILNFS